MKTKLTKTEIDSIKRVLKTGTPWKDKQLHYPAGVIINAVLLIEGVQKKAMVESAVGFEGFSTNGWQWDWWQQFSYEGKAYTLSGSGFYGGHEFYRGVTG